ncbi:hypothetical protein D3C86_752380 [compost metagenome]
MTVEELLVVSGSGSLPEIVAVLLYNPEDLTVATITSVALSPLAKSPITQSGSVQVPIDGLALTNV